ncbi:MAG: nicotinate-nucleotide diphosphorylase [Alphaproteobacteria bacterium]
MPQLPPFEILDDAIRRALAEDVGRAGDITSAATIPENTDAEATLVARRSGVIAGMDLVAGTFTRVDKATVFDALARDGETVAAGTALARLSGSARAILTAERAALNFLGHLSGIASATAAFVQAASGTSAKITCTRKTTPGLRVLEKYAVRCGGGGESSLWPRRRDLDKGQSRCDRRRGRRGDSPCKGGCGSLGQD